MARESCAPWLTRPATFDCWGEGIEEGPHYSGGTKEVVKKLHQLEELGHLGVQTMLARYESVSIFCMLGTSQNRLGQAGTK